MKLVVGLLALMSMALCYPLAAQDSSAADKTSQDQSQVSDDIDMDAPLDDDIDMNDGDFEMNDGDFEMNDVDFEMSADDAEFGSEQAPSFLTEFVLDPMRYSIKHEVSNRYDAPYGVVNNRSSLRFEYAKFFLNNYFLQFDTKLIAHWGADHRANGQQKSPLFETNTKEAFLQGSFGDTSIKLGIQNLIWGESEAGAITDVISPRNNSELFFINLEESRIGQAMINIDQFSSIGDWTVFYIPDAQFNKYGEKGTEYYFDPYNGSVNYTVVEGNNDEFGLSWKKTFGKSDFKVMTASLLDNDYGFRFDGVAANGNQLISKVANRFTLAGFSFNYASGKFLFSGEVASKSSKMFSDNAGQIIDKGVVDTALKLEYSLGASNNMSLEVVNNHISNWDDRIIGVPQDTYTLVFSLFYNFMNEDLSVNYLAINGRPYTSYIHSLFVSYKWDDNIIVDFDVHVQDVTDTRSPIYSNRNQTQTVFKIQYQF